MSAPDPRPAPAARAVKSTKNGAPVTTGHDFGGKAPTRGRAVSIGFTAWRDP